MSNWNIRDEQVWPTSKIHEQLSNPNLDLRHIAIQTMFEELRHRETRNAAAKSAADLLAESKAHHANILTQNDGHHKDVLAQTETHHSQVLAQMRSRTDELRRATRVARWAILFSVVAMIVSAVLPIYLGHKFTKDQQVSTPAPPTKASQSPAQPNINNPAKIQIPLSTPISQTPTLETKPQPQTTNQAQPQSANRANSPTAASQ